MMVWRLGLIIFGCLLLFATFYAFSCKRFTEMMGLGWAGFSIVIALLGIIPGLAVWESVAKLPGIELFFILFISAVVGIFSICMMLSSLAMKNQELAMQVSLLNQENERILKELSKRAEHISSDHTGNML
ncbi:MAG: hypothetical protein PWP24_1946 [Clostridiales bacterium]|nr:hypothetical protein [Clostridiales bacterium]